MRHLSKARAITAAKRLRSKIRAAISHRCARFLNNIGSVLQNMKRGLTIPNTRVDRALYTDSDGIAVLETDAEAVQTRVQSHFNKWFGHCNERLATAPEYIREEYQPQPHILAT